jgi:hypothetical protein
MAMDTGFTPERCVTSSHFVHQMWAGINNLRGGILCDHPNY